MITLLAKLTTMLAINKYLQLGVAILALVGGGTCLTMTLIRLSRNKKRKNSQNAQQVEQQQDTLVQEQAYLEANDNGQLVMTRNVIYSVGLNGKIRAGKYVLTNADESDGKFNVRFNGLVKEYANGDVLTLTDGDTLSPVSGSVVLAPVED